MVKARLEQVNVPKDMIRSYNNLSMLSILPSLGRACSPTSLQIMLLLVPVYVYVQLGYTCTIGSSQAICILYSLMKHVYLNSDL